MEIWNKNINEFKSFGKYLLERLLCIVIAFIFVIGLTYLLFSNAEIINPQEVESQQVLVFGISLENLSIWLGAVAIVITAFWSAFQYHKNKLVRQQEKASEIAKDFADNLIERMGLISAVLMPNHDIQNMIKGLDTSKLKQFTIMEMLGILHDKHCFEKFDKIIDSKRTQKRYIRILKNRYTENERQKFDSSFAFLVENTLNKLEAICINISSQAAGSQFIYESLHQMFLSTIEILSIKISGSNTNNVDKYYMNIISVYNMWNKQKQKDIKKLNKTNKKISKLEKKADKEIKTLLNKQTKTV